MITQGGRNGQFVLLHGTISGNVLGVFYQLSPVGLKDTIFGENMKHLSVRGGEIHCKLHYTEIFMGRNIYSRNLVISIVLITVMIDTELFYLELIHLFIVYYFGYFFPCPVQVCGVSLKRFK